MCIKYETHDLIMEHQNFMQQSELIVTKRFTINIKFMTNNW